MRRTMLKSKIHRATVTQADLHYEGSVTIDDNLLRAADILPNEQVAIWNITNGNRFQTYALRGEAGSGVICINGAAARMVSPGDLVIIASYTEMETKEAVEWEPHLVFVDERNRIKTSSNPAHLSALK
jgi:aspartate 1-decarboxylase